MDLGYFYSPLLYCRRKRFSTGKRTAIRLFEKTMNLGKDYFEQLENPNFGKLSMEEWNVLYYKHLDHHLSQFGV